MMFYFCGASLHCILAFSGSAPNCFISSNQYRSSSTCSPPQPTMQLLRPAAVAAALLLLLLSTAAPSVAHNITRILAEHPEFSTFNHFLSVTHLAADINSRETITVCAVDNAAMDDLLSTHPSIYTIKNILSLHVLLDYFGPKKLHQITNGTALAATMFQATGAATGSSGFVNITDLKGGRVGFGPEDNDGTLSTYFVKSVEELPYNISVIQISKVLPSAEAAAPTPEPSQMNLTGLMSAHGCKEFADTLIANPDATKTYQDNEVGGLTVFCPLDDAFKAFHPKYKNLTAAGKVSFLEFYAVPMYLSMAMLKSNNGLMNTLATDGASKFDFTVQNDGEQITLKTTINTVEITGTLLDQQPLAVYSTDKVLLPKELFKAAAAPTPAPAPAPDAAESPKSSKKKKKASDTADSPSDSPADAPDGDVADQTADGSDGARFGSGRVGVVTVVVFWLGSLLV